MKKLKIKNPTVTKPTLSKPRLKMCPLIKNANCVVRSSLGGINGGLYSSTQDTKKISDKGKKPLSAGRGGKHYSMGSKYTHFN